MGQNQHEEELERISKTYIKKKYITSSAGRYFDESTYVVDILAMNLKNSQQDSITEDTSSYDVLYLL